MPVNRKNSIIMRDRRTIMAALNMVFPGRMPGEEIYTIVLGTNPEYTRVFAMRDLSYLVEKGYLSHGGANGLGAPPNPTVHESTYRLTAHGTDLANQIVHDPTLSL